MYIYRDVYADVYVYTDVCMYVYIYIYNIYIYKERVCENRVE